MNAFLFFLGAAVCATGIAFISWHVALVCIGAFVVFVAVQLEKTAIPLIGKSNPM